MYFSSHTNDSVPLRLRGDFGIKPTGVFCVQPPNLSPMKAKNFALLFLLFLGFGLLNELDAQRGPRARRNHPVAARQADKVHARRVIRRTAIVIRHAHTLVKENKNYTGDLARSIAHQRFARKLYFEGRYLRAMHQSRRGRQLALLSIKANKGTEPAGSGYEKEDEEIMNAENVSDADLDTELDKNMPGYSTKDEDFVNAALEEIDLTDME